MFEKIVLTEHVTFVILTSHIWESSGPFGQSDYPYERIEYQW